MPSARRVARQPLWLELPPIDERAPSRLLVFLHGAGSTPEAFAPVALAWQLKFPGATALILSGLRPGSLGGRDWFDGSGIAHDQAGRIREAALTVGERIRAQHRHTGLDAAQTALVGFSQGATVAIECLREPSTGVASMVISHAGRLARPIAPHESVDADVHLLHGALVTLVPLVHARRALHGLSAAGARVTLDVVGDGVHSIGQDMVNIGTARAMQTIFRGRRRHRVGVERATRTLQ